MKKPRRKPSKYASLKSLNLSPDYVIDVGAWKETLSLKTLYPNATHHLYETDEKHLPKLSENYAHIKHKIFSHGSVPMIPIDSKVLLKIDTDGCDLKILIGTNLQSVSVAVVEVTHNNVPEMFNIFREAGFELYDIVDIGYMHGWLHQFDAIFIRSNERPAPSLKGWDEPYSLDITE